MLVTKLLFNSVISTPEAWSVTMDISNFYVITLLAQPEYVRMKLSDIPDEVITAYNIQEKATKDDSVYIVATKGMIGLPHSGLLANVLLKLTTQQTRLPTE